MRNQVESEGSTGGADEEGQGDVEEMTRYKAAPALMAATSSPILPASPSLPGTGPRRRSRPTATRTISQDTDALLQSPILPSYQHNITNNNKLPARNPFEAAAAVWDWQAPSPIAPASASTTTSTYFFEPQGELLLRDSPTLHAAQTLRANESSIPEPPSATTIKPQHQTQPTNPLEALLAANITFPTSPNFRGTKRKSAPDISFPSSTLDYASSKRPALDLMGEGRPGERGALLRSSHATASASSSVNMALPARKVFPIQIGDKLFRLSGASISSDAPSYFTQFFQDQLKQPRQEGSASSPSSTDASSVRTLYIDRDPATFSDISLHLQGYHVEPRDGTHFVKLFADAQFFSLPRLIAQLHASPIHTTIGSTPFTIPRDLFANSPGNAPNYFTLGFQIFFTTPSDAFPGLAQRTLLRPPSLLPPCVATRDAGVFADLLRMLKGYEIEVRGEEHRRCLVRDARYFGFRGLEQRLVRYRISLASTATASRDLGDCAVKEEITLALEDVRQSGILFVALGDKEEACDGMKEWSGSGRLRGEVHYARPHVDDEARRLVLEVGGEGSVRVMLDNEGRVGQVRFWGQTAARMRKLVSVVGVRVGLSEGVCVVDVGGEGVPFVLRCCAVDKEADVVVDGRRWEYDDDCAGRDAMMEGKGEGGWMVKKSQWRVKAAASTDGKLEVGLEAVKIQAYSGEGARNEGLDFL